MAESASRRTQLPLEVDRIQSSRSAVGETRLRLSGRWLDSQGESSGEEGLLVVHVEGRRHRFAADRDAAPEPGAQPGQWSASFTVPSWAEPRQDGQAALWLGSAVIPVPALHGAVATLRPDDDRLGSPRRDLRSAPGRCGRRSPASGPRRPRRRSRRLQRRPRSPPRPRAVRSPTLLLKDTVAALQAELEQRTAEATRIRGALAAAQSELDARGARDSQLETVLDELRGELERLRAAVEAQRRELEQQSADAASLRERLAAAEAAAELREAEAVALRTELAAANVSREAASGEAAGLRAELERVGSERAVTHERRRQRDRRPG